MEPRVPATTLSFARFDSPWGSAVVGVEGERICALVFADESTDSMAELLRIRPGARWHEDPVGCRGIVRRLLDSGLDKPPVPVALHGTRFQRQVWRVLCEIPRGEVRTYAWVARRVARPAAARAVGRAVGANPVSVLVPCHRVVRSDGGLGGYRWGVGIKRALLAAEGSTLPDGRRIC